jgi:hypothetical protein
MKITKFLEYWGSLYAIGDYFCFFGAAATSINHSRTPKSPENTMKRQKAVVRFHNGRHVSPAGKFHMQRAGMHGLTRKTGTPTFGLFHVL